MISKVPASSQPIDSLVDTRDGLSALSESTYCIPGGKNMKLAMQAARRGIQSHFRRDAFYFVGQSNEITIQPQQPSESLYRQR